MVPLPNLKKIEELIFQWRRLSSFEFIVIIFTENHLCWSLFLIKLFPCEYCEIFKNTYFEEHLRTAVSAYFVAITVEANAKFYQES